MKYWVLALTIILVACSVSPTREPIITETPSPATSTPQIIEVTRVINIVQTVIVTITPEPFLAQGCFDRAVTQADLNGCAAEERLLAQAELDNTVLLIKAKFNFSLEDERIFDNLQKEWGDIVERNCNFYYEKWGSMGPMQRSICIASRIKERIKELEIVYLTPDG